MNDLIKLLEEMGATDITHIDCCVDCDEYEDSLRFTFKGREACINSRWHNDETIGLDAEVSQLGFDENNPTGDGSL